MPDFENDEGLDPDSDYDEGLPDLSEFEEDEAPNDATLIVGEFIRLTLGGPIFQVKMVNEARARCVPISVKTFIKSEDEEETKSAKFTNISPNAVVVRVSRSAALKEATDRNKEKTMAESGGAVGIPVAETSRNEREQNRRTEMAKQKANSSTGKSVAPLAGAAKAAKEKAARAPKTPKTVRICLCGCGGETTGYFVPGHDARFKSWMVKIERGTMQVNELPKSVQKAYEFKKTKTGFVTTLNYKGDKHGGYDNKRG